MNAARVALSRRLALAVAGLLLLTGAVGWLHTPQGIAVLRAAGLPCPATRVAASDVMTVRAAGLSQLPVGEPAPHRPGLPFELEATTRSQAAGWAAASGVACDAIDKGLSFLRCRGFDAGLLGVAGPPVSELWLSFRPDGRLIGVDVYRRGLDDGGAATAWSDAARRLRAALGEPSRVFGDPAPAVLRASALQTAGIEYRYREYVATVTAANLPHAGLAVRERYLSVLR